MTGAQGIVALRKLLLRRDSKVNLVAIGVHSCKFTFLSWSRQLNVAEGVRKAQGFTPYPIWT